MSLEKKRMFKIQGLPFISEVHLSLYALSCVKLASLLPTRFSVHPCLSVCLPVLHASTICHSMNSTAIEAQNSAPRLGSHSTASALIFWSLTGVNEFPDKIPRSEGKSGGGSRGGMSVRVNRSKTAGSERLSGNLANIHVLSSFLTQERTAEVVRCNQLNITEYKGLSAVI